MVLRRSSIVLNEKDKENWRQRWMGRVKEKSFKIISTLDLR